MPSTTYRRTVRAAALAAVVPVALVLSACGSAGSGGTAAGVPSASPSSSGNGFGSGQGGGGFGGGALPGADGLIAAVSPGTLQVQGTNAQTTVTYGTSTRFSEIVAATVANGDCVVMTGAPVAGSATALTATTVRISAKVAGSCPATASRAGNGGGTNGFPSGSSRPRPSGAPSGASGGRDLAFASGTVTGVSGGTVTVQGVLREGRASASASPQATTPTILTVTIGSDASVTETVAATSKVAVVGMCAAALGKADDRGDIAATSITVSKPDASAGCRAAGGFGLFGGGRGTGSGAGSGSGSGSSA